MLPRAGASFSAKTAFRRLSTSEIAPIIKQTQLEFVQRAQADLAKDLNLAVGSRKAAAQRLNGPSLPVSRNGDIDIVPSQGKPGPSHSDKRPITPLVTLPLLSASDQPVESPPAESGATLYPPRKAKTKVLLKRWTPTKLKKLLPRGVKPVRPIRKPPARTQADDRAASTSIQPVASSSKIKANTNRRPGKQKQVAQAPKLETEEIEGVAKETPPHLDSKDSLMDRESISSGTINATDVEINQVKPHREMIVSRLRSQLSRVLFSPGVHPMHDPRTGVWNFEETGLHQIPQPQEFAFDRTPKYISPSHDTELSALAEEHGCKFTGSTSTLTRALSQIYFALSGGKGVDLNTLSQAFSFEKSDFTAGASLAACLVIGKKENGQYYVDSDKQWDVENVLSDFGVILEKMLTTEKEDFTRFLTSSPPESVSEEERTRREAYMYQKSSKLLMRSQLDCYDPRLPGSGVFDIKTRACLPIRYDRANYIANSAYDISKDRGSKQSYEKEYYDLLRAGMLKFSFQVRIGAMDGIFVAYHNTARIYGFQYLPLTELDERLFGSTEMADQAFKLCVKSMEILLEEVVKPFPDQEVEVTIKRINSKKEQRVSAFVQPQKWNEADGPRPIQIISLSFENFINGERIVGPLAFSADEEVRREQKWSVGYILSKSKMDASSQAAAATQLSASRRDLASMMYIALPEGKTEEQMKDADRQSIRNPTDKNVSDLIKWRAPDGKILSLRREAKESGQAYEQRKASWKKDQKSWLPAE